MKCSFLSLSLVATSLLVASMMPLSAHAASDSEMRRAILDLNRQISTLNQSIKQLNQNISRLTESNKNLAYQLQQIEIKNRMNIPTPQKRLN